MFNKKKYFFISMFSTAIVLIMLLGFAIVEKNVSAIITPEKPTFFSYRLAESAPRTIKIHFMSKDFVLRIF